MTDHFIDPRYRQYESAKHALTRRGGCGGMVSAIVLGIVLTSFALMAFAGSASVQRVKHNPELEMLYLRIRHLEERVHALDKWKAGYDDDRCNGPGRYDAMREGVYCG